MSEWKEGRVKESGEGQINGEPGGGRRSGEEEQNKVGLGSVLYVFKPQILGLLVKWE